MPRVVVHNPVLAYENGDEFMQAWYDAEAGKLDPFVLVVEGSIPNEKINGEGHWAGMGVNPETGQPITTNEWIDRLAPKAAAVVAVGTCATYGGIPAMKNNPTGAMGVPRLPRLELEVQGRPAGRQHPGLPGAARQHDRDADVPRLRASAAWRRRPSSTTQLRPKWLFGRTVRESCNRAGFAEQGEFATEYGSTPAAWSSSAARARWSSATCRSAAGSRGIGGCPNVGGICMACTMPGFPDKYMPFMDEDKMGGARGQLRAVHLRPDGPLLPQPQHQEQVRQGARVAAQPRPSSRPATSKRW